MPVGAFWGAAMMNRVDSTTSTLSTQSSQTISHAVQEHIPLPKWVKALLVLGSLGVVSGAVVGSVKMEDAIVGSVHN